MKRVRIGISRLQASLDDLDKIMVIEANHIEALRKVGRHILFDPVFIKETETLLKKYKDKIDVITKDLMDK